MKQQFEPTTATLREIQEHGRMISFREHSLEYCEAVEAFEALYKALRDAYIELPVLQKALQPWVIECYLLGDCAGGKGQVEIEKGLREIAHELPRLILIARGMRAAVHETALSVREEALEDFDPDPEAIKREWWLEEIKKDVEWLAREPGVNRG